MIKNERQYRIAKAQAGKFSHAIDEAETSGGSLDSTLLKAEIDGMRSQLQDLNFELREYENLRAGKYDALQVDAFDELPDALIKARIASGLSQKDLAEKLNIKEQQLQRYEATSYESASFERLKEVVNALGLRIRKDVFLPTVEVSFTRLFRTLSISGFSKDFVINKFLPSEIQTNWKELKGEEGTRSALRTAARISRILKCPTSALFSISPINFESMGLASVRFKAPNKVNQKHFSAYTYYANYLAKLTIEATADLPQSEISVSPIEFRQKVVSKYGSLTFRNTLKYYWSIGVAVLPLRDSGAFHGACFRENGRNVIVIKQSTDSIARWMNDLLHEGYHAGQEPDRPNRDVIELDESSEERNSSQEEIAATRFASDVLLDNRAEELAEKCVKAANHSVERLKQVVPTIAQRENVSIGALANYMAFRLSHERITNWWGVATKLQEKSGTPWQIAREVFFEHANLYALSEVDRAILEQSLTNTGGEINA